MTAGSARALFMFVALALVSIYLSWCASRSGRRDQRGREVVAYARSYRIGLALFLFAFAAGGAAAPSLLPSRPGEIGRGVEAVLMPAFGFFLAIAGGFYLQRIGRFALAFDERGFEVRGHSAAGRVHPWSSVRSAKEDPAVGTLDIAFAGTTVQVNKAMHGFNSLREPAPRRACARGRRLERFRPGPHRLVTARLVDPLSPAAGHFTFSL